MKRLLLLPAALLSIFVFDPRESLADDCNRLGSESRDCTGDNDNSTESDCRCRVCESDGGVLGCQIRLSSRTCNNVIMQDCDAFGSCQCQLERPFDWSGSGVRYALNAKVLYKGTVWLARQAHASQPAWAPGKVPSLWHKPTPLNTEPWRSQTIYPVGHPVTFNGHYYTCVIGHTSESTWDPVRAPALWKLFR